MELKTADMVRVCAALGIDHDDLILTGQPCTHMQMAEILGKELSLLTYEEACELVGDTDGEIWVRVSARQPRLHLAPGLKEVPGDGLPTLEEQLQAERDYADAVTAELLAQQEASNAD